MAQIQNGVFSKVKGSVGGTTFSNWKGINTVKQKPTSVANPRTTGQVNQRTKFSACVAIASILLANIIIPLWNRFAKKASGYNDFVSANVANFSDTGEISPTSMIYSKGKLGSTAITSVVLDFSAKTLTVNYPTTLDNQFQAGTDIAYTVVVNPLDNSVLLAGETTGTRADGSFTVSGIDDMPNVGTELAVSLMFKRTDGTYVGDSNTGLWEVQA